MLKLTLRLINSIEVLFILSLLTKETYCTVLPINCMIIVIA